MNILSKSYIVDEIVDTICMMQLNNENVPELSNSEIERLADDFIFEWNEVGDFDADIERTLRQFLTYQFTSF